jgi:hypothetical protein
MALAQTSYITWIIERSTGKGPVRIGVLVSRFVAELAGKPVDLPHGDIVAVNDLAASRATAHLVRPLRDGGYTHLLGGKIGLFQEEAAILKAVAQRTPEGLRIRRSKIVEAMERERAAQPVATGEVNVTGIAHHGDEREARISAARAALAAFDQTYPQVLASIARD